MILEQALSRRASFFERMNSEKTNCYRLFHGVAEGAPGLTIDRYGSLVLVQTFRDALAPEEITRWENDLRGRLPFEFDFAYNHRGKSAKEPFAKWHEPTAQALTEREGIEFENRYFIRARHEGLDPWLYLDLRAGRRFIRNEAEGKTLLNLFSYTCSVGLTAARAGAKEVWNVDFAASNLEIGRRNADLNHVSPARFLTLQEDCLPTMRQLAGLPAGGRRGKVKPPKKLDARTFDFVVLDPPAWARGPFGAIDVEGDYASLFKPAVLIAKPRGGRILATNHVASVDLETWIDQLRRCANKAGRPLRSVEILPPEEDFPSFDGKPPLKIAVCEV